MKGGGKDAVSEYIPKFRFEATVRTWYGCPCKACWTVSGKTERVLIW